MFESVGGIKCSDGWGGGRGGGELGLLEYMV